MKNNFDLRKFLVENKLTINSVNENQERDHQFYANKEQAQIVMQIAKDAIALIDEQPDTSAVDALKAVIEELY